MAPPLPPSAAVTTVAGRPLPRRGRKGCQGELDRLQQAVSMPARLAPVLGAEALTWVVLLLTMPIAAVRLNLTVGLPMERLPEVDNDYRWHLATGNWIIEHGRVPTSDPFSGTMPGTDWVAYELLDEVMFALSDRLSGYAGGIALTGIVAVAGFWALIEMTRAYGPSRRASCLLMLLWGGVFLRSGVMVVRPQVLTFALLAILFVAIASCETGRWRTPWILPPLFAVWVNVNPTALTGVLCHGAFGLDRLLRGRLDRHLIAVGVLSGRALLLNPQGPVPLTTALKYSDSDALR